VKLIGPLEAALCCIAPGDGQPLPCRLAAMFAVKREPEFGAPLLVTCPSFAGQLGARRGRGRHLGRQSGDFSLPDEATVAAAWTTRG
jgi:hypothetical protein